MAGELFNALCAIAPVREFEPMNAHTTFRIGGPARYFAEPENEDALKQLLRFTHEAGVTPFIMGRGSNLLIADEGIDTVVIHLGDRFSGIRFDGETVTALAGTSLSALSQAAAENGLTGLEFASGIPGSLGGAVYMNAGAYGGEMKEIVRETTALLPDGTEKTVTEHGFGYRKSIFSGTNETIVKSTLKLLPGDRDKIRGSMAELAARRREKQPINLPSAGSVFKRPEGHFAGALIEQAGMKGVRVGGAEVSEKHAGFIVNIGGATCKDVRALVKKIQVAVLAESGVLLESELRYVGRDGICVSLS